MRQECDRLLVAAERHHLASLHYLLPVERLQRLSFQAPLLLLILQVIDLVVADAHAIDLQTANLCCAIPLSIENLLLPLLRKRTRRPPFTV